MKILFYTIVFILFALVTFFGMGPILMADGQIGERIVTLIIVLLLYFILGWIVVRFRKRNKDNIK